MIHRKLLDTELILFGVFVGTRQLNGPFKIFSGIFNDIKKSNGPALSVFQSPVKIACASADTDGASES